MAESADIEELMLEVKKVVEGNGQNGSKLQAINYLVGADEDGNDINFIWSLNPDVDIISDGGGFVGPAKGFIKRLIRKSIRWYIGQIVQRVNVFHASIVNAVNKINLRLNTSEARLGDQSSAIIRLSQKIVELEKVIDAYKEKAVETRLDKAERKIRLVDRQLRDKVSRDTMLWHRKRTVREVFDVDYVGFEDRYRGGEALIRERQSAFIRFFAGRENVLDIGCGRGEFLELLKEHGISATGIDLDEMMVERCLAKGLEARQKEGLAYLRGVEDASLGGIFLGQVVEHLTSSELIQLTEMCFDKLKRDSYLVIETINPLCITTLSTFYLDISHKKPVHPEFLRFHLESLGFKATELSFISPTDEDRKLRALDTGSTGLSHDKIILNENFDKLNQLLFSFQDYVLAAKK